MEWLTYLRKVLPSELRGFLSMVSKNFKILRSCRFCTKSVVGVQVFQNAPAHIALQHIFTASSQLLWHLLQKYGAVTDLASTLDYLHGPVRKREREREREIQPQEESGTWFPVGSQIFLGFDFLTRFQKWHVILLKKTCTKSISYMTINYSNQGVAAIVVNVFNTGLLRMYITIRFKLIWIGMQFNYR